MVNNGSDTNEMIVDGQILVNISQQLWSTVDTTGQPFLIGHLAVGQPLVSL